MTVSDLICTLLGNIRNQWYADRVREFKRDERALMKAVARYGHECHQRGWDFAPADIQRDLLGLLQEIKRTGGDINYLPVYLDGAVCRHIGQRAEELQAGAIRTGRYISKIVANSQQVEVVRQTGACEILSILYMDLKRRRRKPAPVKACQEDLL